MRQAQQASHLEQDLRTARTDVRQNEYDPCTDWEMCRDLGDKMWEERGEYEALLEAITYYEKARDELQASALSPPERLEALTPLLLRTSQAYFLAGYTSAPIKSEMDDADEDRRTAYSAFMRGEERAREALTLYLEPERVEALLNESSERALARELLSVQDSEALKALYWYAMNAQEGALISYGKDFMRERAVVEGIFSDLERREPGYGYGHASAGLGAHHARYGSGGGDPEKSKAYFDRSVELMPNNIMLPVLYAEHYAVKTQSQVLFDSLLERALQTPPGLIEELEPENQLALKRAERLKRARNELFY